MFFFVSKLARPAGYSRHLWSYGTHCYSFCADGSTDTLEVSAEGITGRVLLILTEIISILLWLIIFAQAAYFLLGQCACTSVVGLEDLYVVSS